MSTIQLKELIHIDHQSGIPLYRQIVNSVIQAVASEQLKIGSLLPSINQVKYRHEVSRDTVIAAYDELRSIGLVAASQGKGYYIASDQVDRHHRICLLFDEFSDYKQVLYHSFKQAMGTKAVIDLFFHHFNPNIFESLLKEKAGLYTAFVLMPLRHRRLNQLVWSMASENTYILDQDLLPKQFHLPGVVQNFREDMFQALVQVLPQLSAYRRLIMLYPEPENPTTSYITKKWIRGFQRFCQHYQLKGISSSQIDKKLKKGDVYLVINDLHLVQIIKLAKAKNLQAGEDYGLISMNETPLKEVIGEGITTFSTDFHQMGLTLANMISQGKPEKIHNPMVVNQRNSI
ncbi:MAG: GntR family transcriptional regulator [Candidatus Cyclobacteriaceae bacterium M3_2C_046]